MLTGVKADIHRIFHKLHKVTNPNLVTATRSLRSLEGGQNNDRNPSAPIYRSSLKPAAAVPTKGIRSPYDALGSPSSTKMEADKK
ncbi:hypothetical protein FPCIR_1251 [Fusarium pseudocircinatum]|uniref:Uncharacterized protein n=1 Tax=Fusarium pseudocircinatum TaxID=56676 RepID=A0A8H5PVI5_9HYPO|nr:hypothetical protein FPCIR_1251 [Fusarium pseudocircinatum]